METNDPNKTATEVRQGNRRRMTLRILIWSTFGAAALILLFYVYYVLTAPQVGA